MDELPLITTVAAGFTVAWALGLVTQYLRLSPIVGYLLAGVIIGPHSPGFVADIHLAHQLAELGIILLMFGVGLHFHWHDLIAVKSVAVPGAVGQSAVATVLGVLVFAALGMSTKAGLVIGMAMSVASTVVLIRVLMDANVLQSPEGHLAVGWLLVEDIFTVVLLVLIPVMGAESGEAASAAEAANPGLAILAALAKLAVLVLLVIVAGARLVPWVLLQVVRLRSRELFTLTVLMFSIAIAAGAYYAFGASMALGAFLAGMVVAQSPVSHQAAADALPLRDAFAVLFFVSAGMLFDPAFIVEQPLMVLGGLGIVLLAKPLAALIIVAVAGRSVRTALTVALGLAQIGEFSFILSEVARKHGLLPVEGHNVLVGTAILSIALNPLLFRALPHVEAWLKRRPRLWKTLNYRAESRLQQTNVAAAAQVAHDAGGETRLAIVVGYGPVGRAVAGLLRDAGLSTVIIDMNMDTISELTRQGEPAIFGDAAREAVLEQAGIRRASHLVLTLPQASDRVPIVSTARHLNPKVRILVRARYLREREVLEQAGATAAVFEEGEAAVELARLVLADTGASREVVERTVRDLRLRLILENVANLGGQFVRNIMVPWTRVRRLPDNASLDTIRKQISEQRFSRWPVIDSQTGRPRGYLLSKDLVTETGDWTKLIRPLKTARATDTIEAMLQRFQEEGSTICLVVEGDSPVGIITLEDILEQVVGRIEDEYPRHALVSLREAVLAGGMVLNLQAQSPEEAIQEMAAAILPDRLPPDVDIAKLAVARERELPTDVGLGVAIPHARCPGLPRPLVVFGRSAGGITFSVQSGEPVRLIFLLVTPAEQPEMQVQLLGQLAGLAGNPTVRQRLSESTSPVEILECFSDTAAAA